MNKVCRLILAAACALSLSSAIRAETEIDTRLGETVVMVASSRDPSLRFETTLFWPAGNVADDAPVVLINHGTSPRSPHPRYRPLSAVNDRSQR